MDIVEPRATELLELVHAELKHGGLDTRLGAGVVLTGGGARLRGLAELVERLFGTAVRIGRPRGLARLPEEFAQPEFTVAAGLALYGNRAQPGAVKQTASWRQKLKEAWKG